MTPKIEQDGWVFDTVKHATIAPRKNTTKRRKLSVIHANGQSIHTDPEEAFSQLSIKDTPLGYSSPPTGTVRKTTIRKQPSIMQLQSPVRSRQASAQKQPLQPDINFGNTGSTVRVFRRVSDNSTTAQVNSDMSSDGMGRDENRPPSTETVTKEALLGRRVFAKVVDPAFQELHAQTSNQAKREALSRLADAWSALDAIDPEGEYQLLKAMMDRAQADPKLSSNLVPAKGTSRDGTPQGTPQRPGPKLVLAQNNPHLKSHRRRQTSVMPELEREERLHNLPGHAIAGMEHTKQLGDVLYGRWADGLRNRWPAIS
jgi:serine/threonine-protein kinase 24/25/MST4